MQKFVSYLRVSTNKQGHDGLGISAQRKAVADYIGSRGTLIEETIEVESGRKSDRPQLLKALSLSRLHGAILVVAKLDRLSRDAFFLLGLQRSGAEIAFCDLPNSNKLTIQLMSVLAEEETRMISARTKAALAAAKAKGIKLGTPENLTLAAKRKGAKASLRARRTAADVFAADLAPLLDDIEQSGVTSLSGIARALNERKVPTRWGRASWDGTQVRLLKKRLSKGRATA